MKKIIIAIFFPGIISVSLFAQLTPEQRIQDSVVGWWSNNKFDHLKSPTDLAGKKQEALVNKMVEWMKKSYTPVAGLGTTSRFINKMSYGVLCYVWNVSHKKEWTAPNGNFIPISEENTPFWIAANKTFGSFIIPLFQKTNEYYFTLQPDGFGATDQAIKNREKGDPRIHPNTYKYLTWINDWQTVYLTPNNKLPFIAITKGDLLQRAEESLDQQLDDELKDIQAKWPNNKKTQDEVMVLRKQNIEKYRTNIQKLRERHKNSLNEPAVIRNMQPTMYSFELDPDIFKIDPYEKKLKHYFQVYKVDPELYAKMQSDTPQWIAVAFPYERKEDGNQLYELYRSMSENINYDYIYNYFYNPEKVKGIAYTPANEAPLKVRLNDYRQKNVAAINPVSRLVAQQGNAYFFDDFSSNNEASEPANWFFKRYGKHAIVTTVKNQNGKWLQIGYGSPVSPTLLKKPLPENFTLNYDLATDIDFAGRTGGAARLILNTRQPTVDGAEMLYGEGTTVSIEFAAGNEADYFNNNYRGRLTVKINSSPSANKQNGMEGIFYEYPLREFTNKKTRVHVMVKIKSGVVTILINDKQVAVSTDFKMRYNDKCVTCGVGIAKFNFINWENTTNDSDNVKVYISNVKISRE